MSKVNRIIYLHEHHFSERYFRVFGFPELIAEGFALQIWNFMPFLASEDFLNDTPPDTYVANDHLYYRSCRDAVREIAKIPSDTVIFLGIHYTPRTLPLYRALARTSLKSFSFLAMALPLGTMPPRSGQTEGRHLTLSTIRDRIFYYVPYRALGVKPVDFVLAQGEKYFRHGYPWSEVSEVVWAHSFDYDEYLLARSRPNETDERMCVFLDEYVPLHPDNTAANLSRVPMERYYEQMREFFDHVEKNCGMRVVIAAHPRSHYEELPGIFGERPVIRGKTVDLVKNAGFVIAHQSMSLNFAVLFEKPLIFVVTDDYLRHLAEDPHPEWLAKFFGKKLHNIDEGVSIDFADESYVDKDAYRKYRNDYIKKSGSPEKTFSQIVADRIRAMN